MTSQLKSRGFHSFLIKKSEFNLSPDQIERILNMSEENKIKIYNSYNLKSEASCNLQPAHYIAKIASIIHFMENNTEPIESDLNLIDNLRLELRTRTLR